MQCRCMLCNFAHSPATHQYHAHYGFCLLKSNIRGLSLSTTANYNIKRLKHDSVQSKQKLRKLSLFNFSVTWNNIIKVKCHPRMFYGGAALCSIPGWWASNRSPNFILHVCFNSNRRLKLNLKALVISLFTTCVLRWKISPPVLWHKSHSWDQKPWGPLNIHRYCFQKGGLRADLCFCRHKKVCTLLDKKNNNATLYLLMKTWKLHVRALLFGLQENPLDH